MKHSKIDAAADDALANPGGRPVTPEPFHADMPESVFVKPAEPVAPKLTAFEHVTAALRILERADIETLMAAETDFANFTKPEIGKDLAGAFAELCNSLIDKRYSDHYAGIQHDPFAVSNGDWR